MSKMGKVWLDLGPNGLDGGYVDISFLYDKESEDFGEDVLESDGGLGYGVIGKELKERIKKRLGEDCKTGVASVGRSAMKAVGAGEPFVASKTGNFEWYLGNSSKASSPGEPLTSSKTEDFDGFWFFGNSSSPGEPLAPSKTEDFDWSFGNSSGSGEQLASSKTDDFELYFGNSLKVSDPGPISQIGSTRPPPGFQMLEEKPQTDVDGIWGGRKTPTLSTISGCNTLDLSNAKWFRGFHGGITIGDCFQQRNNGSSGPIQTSGYGGGVGATDDFQELSREEQLADCSSGLHGTIPGGSTQERSNWVPLSSKTTNPKSSGFSKVSRNAKNQYGNFCVAQTPTRNPGNRVSTGVAFSSSGWGTDQKKSLEHRPKLNSREKSIAEFIERYGYGEGLERAATKRPNNTGKYWKKFY